MRQEFVGEMGTFMLLQYQVSSGCCTKIIKIGRYFAEIFKKLKGQERQIVVQNLVGVCHIVWAYLRGPKKFEDPGAPSLSMGRG